MNKLKTVGISALAGTLASFSTAQAGDVSISGAAILSWTQLDNTEVTGNPFGMNKGFTFSYSGELDNGYTWDGFVAYADGTAGLQALTSAATTINMGGLGTLGVNQGAGSAISAIDNVMPTAWEEADDGMDTGVLDVGSNSSGTVLVYTTPTIGGITLAASYNPTATASGTSADGATSGNSTGPGASAKDVTIKIEQMGFTIGAGVAEIDQSQAGAHTAGGNVVDDWFEGTAYIKYAYGPVTLGYQKSAESESTVAGTYDHITNRFYGATLQVNENFSIGYQELKSEAAFNSEASSVEATFKGLSAAYNMGALGLKLKVNEGQNVGYTASTDDKSTEISMSLAF